MTAPQLYLVSGPCLDLSYDVKFFTAVCVIDPLTGYEIRVYRSTDEGKTWSLWGTLASADPNVHYFDPSLHIAFGTQTRLYLAYAYQGGVGANTTVRVAYSPLGDFASWTHRTVFSDAGVDYSHPSLHSSQASEANYVLFLAAQRSDGNGDDISFARSTDYGVSWPSPYLIGSSSSSTYDYRHPFVRYGGGGVVHVAWDYEPRPVSTTDQAVRYRRALNDAAGGIGDWEGVQGLTSASNGVDEWLPSLAASESGGKVIVTYMRSIDDVMQPGQVMLSTDDGHTWAGGSTTFDHDLWATAVPRSDGGFGLMTCSNPDNWGVRTSTYSDPLTFTSHLSLMDRSYNDGSLPGPSNQAFSLSGRSQRLAMVWTRYGAGTVPDTLFFDAEWRRDPGYPNLEPGFPLTLPYDVVSPPAVCELDGDAQSELVFGDTQGYVRAYNHDGTVVTGWPQHADSLLRDEAIAVGDLQIDGQSEVVVGSATGKVYVFRPNGTLMPGWPLDLGTGAAVYVSVGPILGDGKRQIVACSGQKVHLLRYNATEAPGFPITTGTILRAGAAIGDLDGNGTNEIVIVQTCGMDALRANGTVQSFRLPPGKTFSRPATLADLNLDGDLEITMPSNEGDLYVLNPDGTDYPGWPITATSGNPGSSVALAQITGSAEPELVWTEISSNQSLVHAFYQNGTELYAYPQGAGVDWPTYGQPIVDVLKKSISSDIAVGSGDSYGYAWNVAGLSLPEWPKALGGRCEVSAASGDFDQDGHVEIAFCTVSPGGLVVIDLGTDIYRHADEEHRRWWWPMYQYNPQRQGCLSCGIDRVVDVPGESARIARVSFAVPRPNPGSRMSFTFELPARAAVQLVVHDVAGRAVRHLLDSELDPGTHSYSWDGLDDGGSRLPAGVYYAALRVAGAPETEVLTRKAVLLR
jgi:hypothetical protein